MNTPPTCVSIRKSELIKRGINSFQEWNKASNHLYIGRSMDKYITGVLLLNGRIYTHHRSMVLKNV